MCFHAIFTWRVLTFEHTEQHGNKVLLKVEQFLQQIHLGRVLGELFLHVSKEEQEATNSVPQPEKI